MGWTEALQGVAVVLPTLLLLGLWMAWWLLAVNWKTCWPVLARGGWVPLTLLVLVLAGVWSRLDASTVTLGGWYVVPNFLGKLGGAVVLVATALLAGWLQGLLHWLPQEVAVEPPPARHEHH